MTKKFLTGMLLLALGGCPREQVCVERSESYPCVVKTCVKLMNLSDSTCFQTIERTTVCTDCLRWGPK